MTTVYSRIVEEDLELGTGTISVVLPGGVTSTGNKLNLASFSYSLAPTSAVVTTGGGFFSIAAGQTASFAFHIVGAALGDFCVASFNKSLGGLIVTASVDSTDSVVVYAYNPTTSTISITPPVTCNVMLFKVA